MRMSDARYVRVYRSVDATDVAQVHRALMGTHLRYYIHQANYMNAAGDPLAQAGASLMVHEGDVESVKDYLWLRLGLEPGAVPLNARSELGQATEVSGASRLLQLFSVIAVFCVTAFMGYTCHGLVGPPG